tara:strand:+ start:239 stop:607 length:369 start_codon:yes stop_codon:yes gene_type:complete
MKTIGYGLFLWLVPFFVAILVWNVETNSPKISNEWFTGLMGLTWAITYAIIICMYSGGMRWNVSEGWRVGLIWYLTVVLLEIIFIGGIFGNPLESVLHLFLTDSPNLIVTIGIGYAVSKMKR